MFFIKSMADRVANDLPDHNYFFYFYGRYRNAFRLAIHITLWLITAVLASYTIPIATKGYTFATNKLIITTIVQTMAYYYIMGYVILPRYLYHFRPVKLIVWSAIIFFFIHLSNYLIFSYLHQLGETTTEADEYVNRNWHRFKEAGLFGCFTNFRIFLLNIVYSTNVALLYLLPKICKDVITVRFRSLRLEKDKLALELTFLKAQVSPHFLFNTLNSVYADVFDTNEKAADLILRLSELMRYNLYETDLPKITLDKELAYIQNYLDLERNRLSDQYLVIDYEQSGPLEQYQIAPLLLITFVENAFKHGVKGATEPAYVQINADVLSGKLVFRVENSVPAKRLVTETTEKKSGGIGLNNVRRRLGILYDGQYELITNKTETTYTVTLTMQVEPLA